MQWNGPTATTNSCEKFPLVMMMFWGGFPWGVPSVRGILVFFFLLAFHFPHGIVVLHVFNFFGGKFGQVAYEEDELPTLIVLWRVGLAPGRHSCQRDAVANDVIEFTVGEILSRGQTHIRRTGI